MGQAIIQTSRGIGRQGPLSLPFLPPSVGVPLLTESATKLGQVQQGLLLQCLANEVSGIGGCRAILHQLIVFCETVGREVFGQSTVEGRLIVPTRPDQFPLLWSHSYSLISLKLALCEKSNQAWFQKKFKTDW